MPLWPEKCARGDPLPERQDQPITGKKLFCTLGGNIETVAIDGDFDACRALVKQAFDDEELKVALGLNSANSINISRLLAQICYYFEAVAQLPQEARNQLVISVPSGNFGDLTAGLLAKSLGLPVKRFIAATNVNDTVPRFLAEGEWAPKATRRRYRMRWMSASRTTGRAWKNCSAVKSGV